MPPTELFNEGWMLRLMLDRSRRQESDAAQQPTDRSTRTPRSRKHRLGWILVLALVVAAGWLLWKH